MAAILRKEHKFVLAHKFSGHAHMMNVSLEAVLPSYSCAVCLAEASQLMHTTSWVQVLASKFRVWLARARHACLQFAIMGEGHTNPAHRFHWISDSGPQTEACAPLANLGSL